MLDFVGWVVGAVGAPLTSPQRSFNVTKTLIRLAANCGIDARKMTVDELRGSHATIKDPEYADQHDLALEAALDKLAAAASRAKVCA